MVWKTKASWFQNWSSTFHYILSVCLSFSPSVCPCSSAQLATSRQTCSDVSLVTCQVSHVTFYSKTVSARELTFWENVPLTPVACHMSHVTCHMSQVTCHVSSVMCHVSHFFFLFHKVVELVGGGSAIDEVYPVNFIMQFSSNFVHLTSECLKYHSPLFFQSSFIPNQLVRVTQERIWKKIFGNSLLL